MFASRLVLAIYLGVLGLSWGSPVDPLAQNSPASALISPHEENRGFVGDLACRACHQGKFDSYLATAHYKTSRFPDATSIAGSFAKGHGVMSTLNPELTFQM